MEQTQCILINCHQRNSACDRAAALGTDHCLSVFTYTVCLFRTSISIHTGYRQASNMVSEISSVSIHVRVCLIDTFNPIYLFYRVSTSITGAATKPSVPLRSLKMYICCCWLRYVKSSITMFVLSLFRLLICQRFFFA